MLSARPGAVITYNPVIPYLAYPHDYHLYLSQGIEKNPTIVRSDIRSTIARSSLRRTRLGRDVIPFATIRSAALRIEQEQKAASGATDSEQLQAANRRSQALEKENEALRSEVDQSFDLAADEDRKSTRLNSSH